MICPICRKPASAHYKPFCSRRCADVDLGRWFAGSYAVPAEMAGADDIEDDAAETGDALRDGVEEGVEEGRA